MMKFLDRRKGFEARGKLKVLFSSLEYLMEKLVSLEGISLPIYVLTDSVFRSLEFL